MKLKNYAIVLAIGIMSLFSSCGDKYYPEGDTIINGTSIFSEYFEIQKNEFEWNPDYNRFECVIDNTEITDEVFDYGIVYGTVLIDEIGKDGTVFQTQKTLTFKRKFTFPAGSNQSYEEVISADITPGAIGFFIEGLKETDRRVLMDKYIFKISIVWDATVRGRQQARIPF